MSNYLSKPVTVIKLRGREKEEISVSRETGGRIRAALSSLSQHKFITLSEHNRTIHTSKIDDVYDTVERVDAPAEDSRPLTKEEQARSERKMRSVREVLEKRGVLRPRELQTEEK